MKVPARQTRWRTIFYRLACVNVDISMELAVKVHQKPGIWKANYIRVV